MIIEDDSERVMAEYAICESANSEFFIRIFVERQVFDTIGPFDTEAEAKAMLDDLLQMMRDGGAIDMPVMQ